MQQQQHQLQEARNLVETLQTLLNPVSVVVTSSGGSTVNSVNIATPTIHNSSPISGRGVQPTNSQGSGILAQPTNTPYEIHQRLFGYKRKSKNPPRPTDSSAKKPKQDHDVSWTHIFVCLPYKDMENVPADYSLMTANGLGKAKLKLSENSSAMKIHEAIITKFPKLANCGGYELLRTIDNTKRLKVLACPTEGYTGQFLKKVLGQANCYIRPLQHDIELQECPAITSGVEIPESVPRIKCETCSQLIPMIIFREHMEECHEMEEADVTITKVESNESEMNDEISPIDNDQQEMNTLSPIPPSYSPLSFHDDDNDVFEPLPVFRYDVPITSINDVVERIRRDNNIIIADGDNFDDTSSGGKMYIDVRREYFLKDALRECKKSKFDPKKLLRVQFVGEDAIDTGGPRREFFELIIRNGIIKYCVGEESKMTFFQSTAALQKLELKHFGMYVAISIAQSGRGFPVLHPCVYNYIWSGKYIGAQINDDGIMHGCIRNLVEELRKCDSDDSIRNVFQCNEYMDVLYDTGYSKAISKLNLNDRSELIDILKCHSIKSSIPEINQFCEGLESLDVLSYIKKYPDIMRDLFVDNGKRLTSIDFKELFRIIYSDIIAPERAAEEATYINFVDFVEKCEEGNVLVSVRHNDKAEMRMEKLTLEDIMFFSTGSRAVPAGGFHTTPSIIFLHGTDKELVTASTCSLQLRLPTKYSDDPEMFEERLILSFKGHMGFGIK